MIQGFLYGFIGAFFLVAVIGGITFAFWIMDSIRNNKMFVIFNISGGKYDLEYRRGRVIDHKTLGRVYYIPSKQKQGSLQFAHYFGSKYEYPSQKNQQRIVPLVCDGQVYTPLELAHTTTKTEKFLEEFTQDKEVNGKTISVKDFRIAEKTIEVPIMKPISSDQVSFFLQEQQSLLEETTGDLSWWERNKSFVMLMGMVFAGVIIIVFAMIFSYQIYVNDTAVPGWIADFIAASESGQAPPQ